MGTVGFILLSINIIFAIYIIYVAIGVLKVPRLNSFHSSKEGRQPPLVSIIVPACNEEETIKEGLESLLNLQYPNIEIVLVNDRSSDKTGEIMKEIEFNHTHVHYIEIKDLPDGWLGKVHSAWEGSKKASGEWLLFTDADITYHPKALNYVMNLLNTKQCDHLTIAPKIIAKSLWLKAIMLMLKLNLFIFLRPQFMHRKSSSAGMGIGAFNILKKEVYQEIGGHEAIRLCVDDDVMLGKLVKKKGYIPYFALGQEFIAVEWYKSLPEMFRGLSKNALPPFLYSLTLMILSFVGTAIIYLSPYMGVFLYEGMYRLIAGISLFIILGFFMMNDHFSKESVVLAIIFPVVYILFVYLLFYGGMRVKLLGGVQWRDTFYSINLLKKHNKIV